MNNKTIGDLRESMFETLQLLKDGKVTIEQAKAMSDIGQVIINTAKVEVDYIKANAGGTSTFLAPPEKTPLPVGITGVHVHRLAG